MARVWKYFIKSQIAFILFQVFEEDALQWEEKLNRMHDIFDVWIDVQRRWVYLDGIFSGSADIKTLLPVETQRFGRFVFLLSIRMQSFYSSQKYPYPHHRGVSFDVHVTSGTSTFLP